MSDRNSIMNRMGIRKKLWMMNIFGVMLPMLLLFALFSYQITASFRERQEKIIEDSIKEVHERIESEFQILERISFSILSDETISNALEDYNDVSEYNRLEMFHSIDNRLRSYLLTYTDLDEIKIYHENVSIDFTGVIEQDSVRMSELDELLDYGSMSSAITMYIDGSDVIIEHVRKLNAKNIDSRNHVRITYKTGHFDRLLENPLLESYDAHFYITDSRGYIGAAGGSDMNLPDMLMRLFDADLTLPGYTVESHEISTFTNSEPYELIVSYDNRSILRSVQGEFIQALILMSAVLIVSFVFVRIVGKNISDRLQILNRTMEQTGTEELAVVEEDLGTDEIGTTAKYYNAMVYKANELYQERANAYEEIEATNEELSSVNEELTASNEEIREQNLKIHDLIYIDQLTGLKNRFAIYQEIEHRMEKEGQYLKMAVLFVDVDNFKNINDSFGHDMGDRVIAATARKLHAFECNDIQIGRFGGDEFLVIITEESRIAQLKSLTGLVESSLASPVTIGHNQFALTVSIGVAVYPDHGLTKEDVIKKADQALYKAKDSGRNQTVFYDESMNEALEKKLALQKSMSGALKNNEFFLVYQPYINVASGKVIGVEALIRWESSELGFVSPFELIVNAEETGFIVELGSWITEEAVKTSKLLKSLFGMQIKMSINVSTVQIESEGFVSRLDYILNKHDVSPSDLCLEMTETVLIKSIEEGVATIHQLKSMGFDIALDDFGTGYSSLSYFKHLPVDTLKIDKAFIDKIDEDRYDQDLVEIMVQVAHKRGVTVTAEGIETKRQKDMVEQSGCDIIQGYYYSKPLKKDELINYIKNRLPVKGTSG